MKWGARRLFNQDFTISQGVRDCDVFVPNTLTLQISEEFILMSLPECTKCWSVAIFLRLRLSDAGQNIAAIFMTPDWSVLSAQKFSLVIIPCDGKSLNLLSVPWMPESLAISIRERKTHKHKQSCGIVPGLVGCQKLVYVFFSRVIPSHKPNPPKNPRTIPGKFCLSVFFFMFFRSQFKSNPLPLRSRPPFTGVTEECKF